MKGLYRDDKYAEAALAASRAAIPKARAAFLEKLKAARSVKVRRADCLAGMCVCLRSHESAQVPSQHCSTCALRQSIGWLCVK